MSDVEISTFSHSQLNAWTRCRFAWNLSYRGEWVKKGPKSAGLRKGSDAHTFLDAFYEATRKNEPYDIKQHLQELIVGVDDYQALEYLENMCWLVGRYIEDIASKDNWEIVASELYFCEVFTTPKGRQYKLEGYIDLVVRINGKLWVIDHKTHGGTQYVWTPEQVQIDSQLATYVVAMRKMGYPVHGVLINQLNTYPYKKRAEVTPDKLFTREPSYRTDVELDAMLDNLGRIVDDIFKNEGDIYRNFTRDCSKFCQFHEPCLLDMKGINISEFLPVAYEKKEKRPVSERGGLPTEESSGYSAPV